ncbi:hypothetical protein [uncultured Aquincola sp.]|uniref:hypothetical protein n=1 Tax=uncultured Aquincola sp. TaxID=886556 RepID=UPI0032B24EA4|tara:strand:- start:1916 stop:2074 length:159 start_codon:yes stop_codon:yes gene_type:complete
MIQALKLRKAIDLGRDVAITIIEFLKNTLVRLPVEKVLSPNLAEFFGSPSQM